LDILAVDKNGKLVVIELKRDIADTFVDLQAIHYAAYCSTLTFEQIVDIKSESNGKSKEENQEEILNFIEEPKFSDFDNQPRIIIVANDFKEETLAAILWLRDSGIDIKCVKLEAHELDEKIIITPDVIIPLPEAKEFMIFREQKSREIGSKYNKISKEIFLENLDENWYDFFKKLLKFSDEKGLIKSWGGTGLSLKVNIEDKNVSLLHCHSKLRVKGQTMFATTDISKYVKNGDKTLAKFIAETIKLSGFEPSANGFSLNLEKGLDNNLWTDFESVLTSIIDEIQEYGLKKKE
jgi:hypothetical protein